MGLVIPLKKSANSAYLELKNHLSEKINKVEALIQQKLKSDVNLIEKMSNHHLGWRLNGQKFFMHSKHLKTVNSKVWKET